MPKIELPKPDISALKTQLGARRKSLVLAGTTLVCALGIGFVMQYALPGAARKAEGPVSLTDITPTSSGSPVTDVPGMGELRGPLVRNSNATSGDSAPLNFAAASGAPVMFTAPAAFVSPPTAQTVEDAPVVLAAAETPTAPLPDAPPAKADPAPACTVGMTANPTPGAMVDVTLTAPCHPSERVTIHHQGMMFTDVTDATGVLAVSVPALAEKALFIASFATGDGATAMAAVDMLPLYDRVAVQWKGAAGLGLHAREFGAAYFTKGHIHAGAAGDLSATAKGESGFLTVLGDADSPEALHAEVYSFPKGAAEHPGSIALTVEAEITASNCDKTIEAQTLEIRDDESLRTRNLTLTMPGCTTTGDFLVLNNLVEDLTIAAR